MGNLGGFVGLCFIGTFKDTDNSFTSGLLVLLALLVGRILTLVVGQDSFFGAIRQVGFITGVTEKDNQELREQVQH